MYNQPPADEAMRFRGGEYRSSYSMRPNDPFAGLAQEAAAPPLADMPFTKRRSPSYCDRLSNAVGGIAIGSVLLVVALGLLFYNEGRAVQTAKSLDEGLEICTQIPITVLDTRNDQRLVYATGQISTDQPLMDNLFGLSVRAAKFERRVEMYQWVERQATEKLNDGSEQATYTYHPEWSAQLIDSSRFRERGHANPTALPFPTTTLVSNSVRLGKFKLSPVLVQQMSEWREFHSHTMPPAMRSKKMRLHDGTFYSADPLYPQVGDHRIRFRFAGLARSSTEHGEAEYVSVVARQRGSQLVSFQTVAGDTLEMLNMGIVPKEDLFANAQAQNASLTWLLRGVGWLLSWLALALVTQIVVTLFSVIPVVGSIVALSRCMLTLTLSLAVSLFVIALGWIRYRPWLGMALLVAASLPLVWGIVKGRSSAKQDKQA